MTASIVDGARWLAAERDALKRVDLKAEAQSVGRVEQIADGVARVSGLPEARLGELLRFEGGRMGYALSLEANAINATIFDEARRSASAHWSARPARSRRSRSVRVCSGASSTRSGARSIATSRSQPKPFIRSSVPRRRSSTAPSSSSPSPPACWWSMRSSRSAAASAS